MWFDFLFFEGFPAVQEGHSGIAFDFGGKKLESSDEAFERK